MEQTVIKTLEFPSTLDDALKAEQRILAEVVAHGYDEDACFAIRLALDEAVSNAIHHGNQADPAKTVRVDYSVSRDTVRIQVTDQGSGFDPGRVPDPREEENLEKPHGRGIMLMRAYMSEVDYNKRGNVVTMLKRRNCVEPMQSRA